MVIGVSFGRTNETAECNGYGVAKQIMANLTAQQNKSVVKSSGES